ncbi:tetratricopeptide repeat protein [Caulobacter sp. 17J65-9]|uniref:tetratricopeptide repeat protein n=1 Tax=Caulobacter sp. 17J65-9 TaxID=2709382 RepID=UPI0013CDBCCB|nr:tetratricopeptide repeat protein [Caulobacter sp. 17J65-9]NEX94052.1 tetratricopeptide repeat protein [Caulobacter sp. 17J65-9]
MFASIVAAVGAAALLGAPVASPPAPRETAPAHASQTQELRARFQDAAAAGELPDAVAVLERIAAAGPGSADWLDSMTANQMRLDLEGESGLTRRYLAALDRADYGGRDPMVWDDDLWLPYAGLTVIDEPAAAARALRRLDSPYAVTRARLDRRFEAVVGADPAWFAARATAERWKAALLAYPRTSPLWANAQNDLAVALLILGETDQSLAVLDTALDLAGRGAVQAEDGDVAWLHGSRALVLLTLGRRTEALAAYREAARLDKGDAPLPSQTVSYARAAIGLGAPEDALAALARIRPEGRYTRAAAASARACALTDLGLRHEASAELAKLRDLRDVAPTAYSDALLCAEDYDAAAAEFIRRLADPETRGEALMLLSDWRMPPHPTPGQTKRAEREAVLKARGDVRAAVAAVGRTEQIDLIN